MIEPIEIIKKYYPPESLLFRILVNHSLVVAEKALKIAEKFPQVDKRFIYEASLLHDIGIFMTYAPKISCFGKEPYIAHGYLGRTLLEKEGLPKHALVCERHIGVGITKEEIIKNKLPLPPRDMVPETWEEKIIAFADKFFTKKINGSVKVNSVEEILEKLAKHGKEKVVIFLEWLELFEK